MHHGMDAVILRRLCGDKCQIGHLHRGHDGIFVVLAFVNDRTVTGHAVNEPVFSFDLGRDCLSSVILRAGDFHEVTRLDGRGGRFCRSGRLRLSTQLRRDLLSKVTHAGVHPVAVTGFVGEPAMYGQHHLVGFRCVIARFRFVSKPEQFGFSVALANVHAELDERLIHNILERIRFGGVGGALDGDGSLVVGIGGGTPGTIFLLHIHTDSTICANSVVATCLLGSGKKDVAKRLHRALTHHTVRRDAVDRVCSLPGVVGVGHHGTVRVSHLSFPHFRCGREAAPVRISASAEWAAPDRSHSQAGIRPRSTGRRK